MPNVENFENSKTVKMLSIGDSGSGKTGALASLVKAGYKIRMLDFDNGIEPLLRHAKDICPEVLKADPNCIHWIACQDPRTAVGGKSIPKGVPKSVPNAIKYLDHWKGKEKDGTEFDFGKPCDWGSDTILALDSLTFYSKACFEYVLVLAGRISSHPQIQDWGAAMDMIEGTLATLYAEDFRPHVIVNSHVSYIENTDSSGSMTRGYPAALGKQLPPKVGRYFNSLVQFKSKGSGASAKRMMRTVPDTLLELKTPLIGCPAELPIETAMAEYFRLATGSPTAPKN